MSGQRGFAMVPAWLLEKQPKGNDILIYCTLASHGSWNPGSGVYESCKPSVELMAEETGLSRSTVKRALDNLLELGAAERTLQYTPEGDSAPSLYRVIFGQVIEPAGVGRSTDEPTPPARRNSRSKGRRSTGEPTSVHERTDGRSTDEPTVGPQVNHNQEPLNQEPMTKSSDPASQGRRTDGSDDDLPDGQTTIDGKVEPGKSAAEKKAERDAGTVAGDWAAVRAKTGCPIVLRGRNADPVAAVRSLVLPALLAGYTDIEVKNALAWLDTGIPSTAQLETALAKVKGGWRPPQGWKPGDPRTAYGAGRQRTGTGAMAGTNRHVDDISEQQRDAENPFAGASRQSDYAKGAVA